ncbi:hypothetical protein PC117_g17532 [Phytophthora cactorum]|nr:hypothetical protein PC117_g17532 [Phytophthora cactorum]
MSRIVAQAWDAIPAKVIANGYIKSDLIPTGPRDRTGRFRIPQVVAGDTPVVCGDNRLKSKYTTISHMLQGSGFRWDPNHNVVLVHDGVWELYVKEHPKAAHYCKKSVSYYDDPVDLFESTYATGEHALSSDEPCPSH